MIIQTGIFPQSVSGPLRAVCLYCQNLLPSRPRSERYPHWSIKVQHTDLLRGLSAGCLYCELILQLFQGQYIVSNGSEPGANATIEFLSRLSNKPGYTKLDHELVTAMHSVYLSLDDGRRSPDYEVYTLRG